MAEQRALRQERGLGQLQSLLGLGMRPAFQYMQIPGQPGAFQKLLSGIGRGIGGLGMGFLGRKLF